MRPPSQTVKRNAVDAASLDRQLPTERGIALLVLSAIAMSILSHSIGYQGGSGEPKNGVRRAASQLARKMTKGNGSLQAALTSRPPVHIFIEPIVDHRPQNLNGVTIK